MASRTDFKYWKNILFRDFMSNFCEMTPQWLQKTISNFMSILYIVLKNVTWRFRICDYFCEISKFRDFMDNLRNFEKRLFLLIFPRNLNISRNNSY